MSPALQQFLTRALTEEGKRAFAYNDATGKTVSCKVMTPAGNLSIGVGINLETGLDAAEIEWLLEHRASLVEQALGAYAWYGSLASSVQSVLIDVGYNAGIGGLMHFPRMLADLAESPPDYGSAANECRVSDPRLDAQRYAPLRAIIAAAAVAPSV